jgi:4-carboxymuconolactone decarboxylase
MRLCPLPPAGLNSEQRQLYQDIAAVIDSSFGELVARGTAMAL